MDVRSRIVGHGEESPDQLLANPLNWRIHPKHQQDAMQGVLEEVGWVQSVIVNRTTGNLVDGHMRVALALRQDLASIPVVYVELTPEEEEIVLATLDPLGAAAATDKVKLAELLADVSVTSQHLERFLSGLGDDGSGMTHAERLAEWAGMPEYEQQNLTPHKTIFVHFKNDEDVAAFAKAIGQAFTPRTKSIWFPVADEPADLSTMRYTADES